MPTASSSSSSDGFESADDEQYGREAVGPTTGHGEGYSRFGILSPAPSTCTSQRQSLASERGDDAAAGASSSVPASDWPQFTDPETGLQHAVDPQLVVRDLSSGASYWVDESGKLLSSAGQAPDGASASGGDSDVPGDGSGAGRHSRQASGSAARGVDGEAAEAEATRVRSSLAGRLKSKLKGGLGKSSKLFNARHGRSMSLEKSDVSPEPSHDMQRDDLGQPVASTSGQGGLPVKVSVHKKSYKEWTEVVMVQDVHAHSGVVWVMKLSRNGRYLATAGQDCEVLVWEIVRTADTEPADRRAGAAGTARDRDKAHGSGSGRGRACDRTLLAPTPLRRFKGHEQDVLDLCWSKHEQLLLSASMDATVRLWHVSVDRCLRVFKHSDFVTCLDFHPTDERHFISGSIDGKVRLWNIPELRVSDWADVHDMVTSVAISCDGGRVVVGTMKGKCRFYSCEPGGKLEYEAQIDVKGKRGKQARKKVTGVAFMPGSATQLLVTSNDSRVRLYDGFILRGKLKGLQNSKTQIKATFSSDGGYVVSGSDDGGVYVWESSSLRRGHHSQQGEHTAHYAGNAVTRNCCTMQGKSATFESFSAFNSIATVAIFGPDSARWPLARASGQGAATDTQSSDKSRRSPMSSGEAAEHSAVADAAVQRAAAAGRLIVVAGYEGHIKVFENLGWPRWL